MLKNKNIVITGSNRGIGKSILEACARYGANVWACMRKISDESLEWMEGLTKKYEVTIRPVLLELSDEESIKRAGSAILTENKRIDGIINNAGITGVKKLFSMTSMDEMRQVFDTNFFGPLYLIQRLQKNMVKNRGGSIVNISSIAALDGEPAQIGYVSSKAALIGATKKLASELSPYGIRVNAVAPGIIDTDMAKNINESLLGSAMENTDLGRLGKPGEIAEVVAFLISDRSSFITGQVIRVDGGKK